RRRVGILRQALGLDRAQGVGGLVDRLAVARHLRGGLALLLVEQPFGFFFDCAGYCPCHFGSPFFHPPRGGARALADRPRHVAGASLQLLEFLDQVRSLRTTGRAGRGRGQRGRASSRSEERRVGRGGSVG